MPRSPAHAERPSPTRSHALTAAAALALVAGGVLTPGCTTPSPEELDETYNALDQHVKDTADYQMRQCEEHAGSSADIAACKARVLEEEFRRLNELSRARQAAHEERWRDARDLRDEIIEELLDLLPEFPELQELIDRLRQMSVVMESSGQVPVAVHMRGEPGGTSLPIEPRPIMTDQYDVSGTVQMMREDGSIHDGVLSGTVNVAPWGNTGGIEGEVVRCMIQVAFPDGDVTYLLERPRENTLTLIDGGYVLDVSMIAAYSDETWDAVLPRLNRFFIPLTRSGGTLSTTTTGEELLAALPHRASPNSDYDLNQVLEYTPDLDAFLASHAAQDPRADINNDGLWTAEDVTAWTSRFLEDAAHAD